MVLLLVQPCVVNKPMEVNLISDTVTRPSAPMLEAMMHAVVGDDVFKDDPSVNALEEKVARLFHKEAALFFPSGTMANQAAIKIHTQPGEQLIARLRIEAEQIRQIALMISNQQAMQQAEYAARMQQQQQFNQQNFGQQQRRW